MKGVSGRVTEVPAAGRGQVIVGHMSPDHETLRSTGDDALPAAPSLPPTLDKLRLPRPRPDEGRQVLRLSLVSGLVAIAAATAAELLLGLINGITNLAFYGRLSLASQSPAGHHLGAGVVLVPVIGGLIVGVMARFGSPAIRGHGIPEAMERILKNESRLTLLKPVSSAVAIGTGGPFGAEGPIIATGGALGSLLGQLLSVTADERKVLLAAGAAAGMSATFGSPVSAVLLAVELLLFEYRPRSLVPVALAAASATSVRLAFEGPAPVFPIPDLASPTGSALAIYAVLGGLMGAMAAGITRLAYGIEDAFEHWGGRLGVHWMWWPIAGAVVVGLVGWVEPR